MSKALFIRAISRFAAGLLLVSGLLFIPAGTWNYPQGWLLIIIKRIRNEELVLAEGLSGYSKYMEKVKYRLIPFVW